MQRLVSVSEHRRLFQNVRQGTIVSALTTLSNISRIAADIADAEGRCLAHIPSGCAWRDSADRKTVAAKALLARGGHPAAIYASGDAADEQDRTQYYRSSTATSVAPQSRQRRTEFEGANRSTANPMKPTGTKLQDSALPWVIQS